MALQSSGQITLDEIHVEAGGTTGTLASINDADIRGLLSPTPASGSEMEFSDWYGASGAGLEVQGTTKNNSDIENYANSFSSSVPVNLTGQSIAVGDLVVIATSSRANLDAGWNWTGMTLTPRSPTNDGPYSSPGREITTGVWASGNSNPYVTSIIDKDGANNANVTVIFRNAGNVLATAVSDQQSGGSTSIPTANLSSYSGSAVTAGFITVIACEQQDVTGAQTITVPSGYTLAGSHISITQDNKGRYRGSFVAVAYKVSTSASAETIGNWTVGAGLTSENHTSVSMRVGA